MVMMMIMVSVGDEDDALCLWWCCLLALSITGGENVACGVASVLRTGGK